MLVHVSVTEVNGGYHILCTNIPEAVCLGRTSASLGFGVQVWRTGGRTGWLCRRLRRCADWDWQQIGRHEGLESETLEKQGEERTSG